MKTDQTPNAAVVFLQAVSIAVAQLKQRLQRDYERVYPSLREIIYRVLEEEETNAWRLSNFPHLVLPDLVEAHITNLNLQPAETKHDDALVPHGLHGFISYQPALGLCGS
jgi:hypothetical protein